MMTQDPSQLPGPGLDTVGHRITQHVLERRHPPDDGPVVAPGDVVRGEVALDRGGRRLAAVVEDLAGVSWIATFERVGDTWQAGARIPAPPGSGGGRIAWLPGP